jgi:hypothetical protein
MCLSGGELLTTIAKYYHQDISKLHTGNPPLWDIQPDMAAMLKVLAGERPERAQGMSEEIWGLVTAAWAPDFRARPTIRDITLAFPTPG